MCHTNLRAYRYSGTVEEGTDLTQKTKIKFTWRLCGRDLDVTREVQLLLHNAIRRGVHLPHEWKGSTNLGFGAPPVDALAEAAVQRVREDMGLADDVKLSCRTLLKSQCSAVLCLRIFSPCVRIS